MKTVRIYKRIIHKQAGLWRWKSFTQYVVDYAGEEFKNNHDEDVNNYHLSNRFVEVFNSRSRRKLDYFISKLQQTASDKWLKDVLKTNVERGI